MYRVDTRKPFVIPVFIPHAGCHHRCVFCDQTRTTSQTGEPATPEELHETIARFLSYRKEPERFTEISFYGGNFLGLPAHRIVDYLALASTYIRQGRVQGIRFSTRPDTINAGQLELLAPYPVSTVELGVQSMNDSVLALSRRGHSVEDTLHAVRLLQTKPYRLGLQMMVGLPGDSIDGAMASGRRLAGLAPDFVRIYPTLVLKGSALARWYGQGRFSPLELDEAVTLVKSLFALFSRAGIKVVRLGLQATDGFQAGTDFMAGPYHPAFGELVHSALWLDAMRNTMDKFRLHGKPVTIQMHPRLHSRVRGQRSGNMETLIKEFSLPPITISTDERFSMAFIKINDQTCRMLN